jgi:hypothetical protein
MAKKTWAEREARKRLRWQSGLNPGADQIEYAFSPSTQAVGMRQVNEDLGWVSDRGFRVFNIHYPMYGKAWLVSDWVSVGVTLPKRT